MLPTPMFHASVIRRGHQILTSGSARTVSPTKNVNRPTCDVPFRKNRPATCRMSSVAVVMACILGGDAT